jgi:hypothetical protein
MGRLEAASAAVVLRALPFDYHSARYHSAMAGIFINYHRDDAPGVAGWLFDFLATRFSRDDLFMDVDAMKPGMDFAQQLDHQVAQCRPSKVFAGQ